MTTGSKNFFCSPSSSFSWFRNRFPSSASMKKCHQDDDSPPDDHTPSSFEMNPNIQQKVYWISKRIFCYPWLRVDMRRMKDQRGWYKGLSTRSWWGELEWWWCRFQLSLKDREGLPVLAERQVPFNICRNLHSCPSWMTRCLHISMIKTVTSSTRHVPIVLQTFHVELINFDEPLQELFLLIIEIELHNTCYHVLRRTE